MSDQNLTFDDDEVTSGKTGLLSETDELLLEAFLDDELSVRDADLLDRRLLNEPELRDGLEALRATRAEYARWFAAEVSVPGRRVDLWRKIEARIDEQRPESAWRRWRGAVGDFLRAPGPSNGAFAAVAACFLGAIAFNFTTLDSGDRFSERNRNSVNRGVSATFETALSPSDGRGENEIPFQFAATGNNLNLNSISPSERNLRFVTAGGDQPLRLRPGREGGAIPLGMAAVQFYLTPRKRGTGGIVSNLPSMENRPNFMRSGMQAGGAEIDWARSDKLLRIVPAKSRDVPPIIWVANATK